jgi:hypothetical protein
MFLRGEWLDSIERPLVRFHTGVFDLAVIGHACLMDANGYAT